MRIGWQAFTNRPDVTRARFLAELARTKCDAFVVDSNDLRRELALAT